MSIYDHEVFNEILMKFVSANNGYVYSIFFYGKKPQSTKTRLALPSEKFPETSYNTLRLQLQWIFTGFV